MAFKKCEDMIIRSTESTNVTSRQTDTQTPHDGRPRLHSITRQKHAITLNLRLWNIFIHHKW